MSNNNNNNNTTNTTTTCLHHYDGKIDQSLMFQNCARDQQVYTAMYLRVRATLSENAARVLDIVKSDPQGNIDPINNLDASQLLYLSLEKAIASDDFLGKITPCPSVTSSTGP